MTTMKEADDEEKEAASPRYASVRHDTFSDGHCRTRVDLPAVSRGLMLGIAEARPVVGEVYDRWRRCSPPAPLLSIACTNKARVMLVETEQRRIDCYGHLDQSCAF